MRVSRNSKGRGHNLLVVIAAFVAVLVAGMPSGVTGESLPGSPAGMQVMAGASGAGGGATKAVSAPPGAAASRVYKDPVTGEMGAPPAAAPSPQVPPAMEGAVNTSSQSLVETQDAAGGIKVDLRGRFRSFATATKGANGQVSTSCSPSVAHGSGRE